MGRIERYRRPEPPRRDPLLDNDDERLIEELRLCEGSRKRERQELAAAFGRWRAAVFSTEAQATSNLVLLLSHYWHAKESGAEDIMSVLEGFLVGEYGVVLDGVELNPCSIRALAETHSRRRDVLSDRLLPKSGLSNRHRKVSAGHPANDEPEECVEQMSIYEVER